MIPSPQNSGTKVFPQDVLNFFTKDTPIFRGGNLPFKQYIYCIIHPPYQAVDWNDHKNNKSATIIYYIPK